MALIQESMRGSKYDVLADLDHMHRSSVSMVDQVAEEMSVLTRNKGFCGI